MSHFIRNPNDEIINIPDIGNQALNHFIETHYIKIAENVGGTNHLPGVSEAVKMTIDHNVIVYHYHEIEYDGFTFLYK